MNSGFGGLIVSLIVASITGYGLWWLANTIWLGAVQQNAWMMLAGGILIWLFGGLLFAGFFLSVLFSLAFFSELVLE